MLWALALSIISLVPLADGVAPVLGRVQHGSLVPSWAPGDRGVAVVPYALHVHAHPPLKTPLEIPLAAERGIPRLLWQAASGAIVGSCTAHSAIQTFWQHAGEFKYFGIFGQLFESIAHRMAGTTKSKVLDALATNILIIRTLVEIRKFLQRQQVGKRLPRRIQRLLRLLPPATGAAIEAWDHSYIMMLFLAINAWGRTIVVRCTLCGSQPCSTLGSVW